MDLDLHIYTVADNKKILPSYPPLPRCRFERVLEAQESLCQTGLRVPVKGCPRHQDQHPAIVKLDLIDSRFRSMPFSNDKNHLM